MALLHTHQHLLNKYDKCMNTSGLVDITARKGVISTNLTKNWYKLDCLKFGK